VRCFAVLLQCNAIFVDVLLRCMSCFKLSRCCVMLSRCRECVCCLYPNSRPPYFVVTLLLHCCYTALTPTHDPELDMAPGLAGVFH
jgi:hypothetical protein